MTAEFKSTHNLPFEAGQWNVGLGDNMAKFRIGTCEGLYCFEKDFYGIIAVVNNTPNNGHFKDVLDWFYNSCKRDKKDLRVLELWNDKFKKHLIEKLGFTDIGNSNVEIKLKKIKKITRIT